MHSKEVISLVQKKREDGLSIRKIAAEIYRTVEYMLNTDYEWKKRGWKKTISKRTERRMKRSVTRLLSSGEKVTAKKVKEKCELDISVRTVQKKATRNWT